MVALFLRLVKRYEDATDNYLCNTVLISILVVGDCPQSLRNVLDMY